MDYMVVSKAEKKATQGGMDYMVVSQAKNKTTAAPVKASESTIPSPPPAKVAESQAPTTVAPTKAKTTPVSAKSTKSTATRTTRPTTVATPTAADGTKIADTKKTTAKPSTKSSKETTRAAGKGKSTKEVGKSTKETGKSTKEVAKSTKETVKSTKEASKSMKETGKGPKQTGKPVRVRRMPDFAAGRRSLIIKLIIILVVVLLVVGGAVGAALYFLLLSKHATTIATTFSPTSPMPIKRKDMNEICKTIKRYQGCWYFEHRYVDSCTAALCTSLMLTPYIYEAGLVFEYKKATEKVAPENGVPCRTQKLIDSRQSLDNIHLGQNKDNFAFDLSAFTYCCIDPNHEFTTVFGNKFKNVGQGRCLFGVCFPLNNSYTSLP